MNDTLEAMDIETNPDYDGSFFDSMIRNGWKIQGKPIYDWIETYKARLAHIEDSTGS